MNKAIFLDRDGTINVDKGYLNKIEEFEYLPGVIEGLKLLQDAGYLLIVITNQSGIARGYYTEEDFHKLNDWMIQDMMDKGVVISKVYYCPHHPSGKIEKYRVNCECRKPKLGMYYQAVSDFDIDLVQSYVVGDKMRDLSICKETECKGYLISQLEKKEILELIRNQNYKNIVHVDSLFMAAQKIVGGK